MEALEILALPFQVGITVEPLPPEKLLVVGVIEAFNHGISPRLRHWNKHRLNPEMQTEPNYQAWRTGVTIAATKAQFIIKEQEIRRPDHFPTAQQALGDLPIRFGSQ